MNINMPKKCGLKNPTKHSEVKDEQSIEKWQWIKRLGGTKVG